MRTVALWLIPAKLSMAACAAVVLSACTKSPEERFTLPPNISPPVQGVVAAYGDSTQLAHGMPHASDRPGWTILNRGVIGTTAGQLLEGKDGLNRPWVEEMAATQAELVIINHALNISGGTTNEDYTRHLSTLVRVALASGRSVMLETPSGGVQAHGEFDVPAFERRVEVMKEVAKKYGTSLCEQPNVPLVDGVHPSSVGYAIKAERLAQCIGAFKATAGLKS